LLLDIVYLRSMSDFNKYLVIFVRYFNVQYEDFG